MDTCRRLPLRRVLALPVAFFLGPIVVASCAGSGDDNGGGPTDGGGDVSVMDVTKDVHDAKYERWSPGKDSAPETGDDTTGDDVIGDDSMEASYPLIRVGHFVPDLGPLDFCFMPAGGAEAGAPIGPMLAQNGLPSGMGYSEVSAYFGVPTGSYKLRLVKPFANDCSSTLGLTDGDVSLQDGSQNTVALQGMSAPDAGLQPFKINEHTDNTVGSGTIVRFLNVMPDTATVSFADSDMFNNNAYSTVFPSIPYGALVPAQSYMFNSFEIATVDSNGYGTFSQGNELYAPLYISSAADAAATQLVVAQTQGLSGLSTAFICGLSAEKPKVPEVVVCSDGAGGGGALSTCHLLQ